jgi:hypothetical protein
MIYVIFIVAYNIYWFDNSTELFLQLTFHIYTKEPENFKFFSNSDEKMAA